MRSIGVLLCVIRCCTPGHLEARPFGRIQFAQAASQPEAPPGSSGSSPIPAQRPATAVPMQQPKPPGKKAASSATPPVASIPTISDVGNLSPPEKTEPVLHAKNAGLGPCTSAVERGSASAVDATHSAFSNWNPGAPNLHAFQSIVIETYKSSAAPRAASVILTSPSATGCDATAIQAFPSARPCIEVEKDILKSSAIIGKLAGLPLYRSNAGEHRVLMPSAGNGCVIIGVSVQYVAGATAAPLSVQPTRPQRPGSFLGCLGSHAGRLVLPSLTRAHIQLARQPTSSQVRCRTVRLSRKLALSYPHVQDV